MFYYSSFLSFATQRADLLGDTVTFLTSFSMLLPIG
jgi:hypothetical protein